ncbi:LuxR C-terminal-related transcriptional regulator [Pseudonocardia alni]|uniref:helix-turn-helix transcriptional regulator n=1 Tax=Pseudonocardia alni TaxID=33907 RepID=UPI00386540B0
MARAVHDTAPPAEGSAAYRDLSAVCADALITLAFCARMEGDPQAARDRLAGASSLAAASGNRVVELRTVWNRGVSFIEDGLLDAAADELAEGARRAAAYGLLWGGYGLEFRIAQVRVDVQRGEWDAAVRTAADVDPTLPLRVTGQLAVAGALVGVARGDLDGAEELLSLLATEPPVHDQAALLQGVVGAESARWRGDPALAVDRVATALGVLRAEYPHHLGELALCALGAAARADLAEAARTAGDPAGRRRTPGRRPASPTRPRSPPSAACPADRRRAGGPGMAGPGPRRGRPGPRRGGTTGLGRRRGDLRRVRRRLPRRGGPVAAGRGPARAGAPRWPRHRRRGRPPRRRGGPGRRRDRGRPARGAPARRGRRRAAAAGRRRRSPARTAVGRGWFPAHPARVTPREHAVLELVAHGLTNRAVGERLFISEKTVSVHLSRAMAKLGASGRAEAVALAHSRGLLGPRD